MGVEKRLLAVEDNPDIAALIGQAGQSVGYITRTATTQREFITHYECFAPHVIVMDIIMPEMDGFEVLRFLKERACQSKIVICSGDGEFRRMAGNIGCTYGLTIEATLPKPFRVSILKEILVNIGDNIAGKTLQKHKVV